VQPSNHKPANLLVWPSALIPAQDTSSAGGDSGLWLERIHSAQFSGSLAGPAVREWLTLLRGSAELAFSGPERAGFSEPRRSL